MSRRFGRNQRRKMREEIEALQCEAHNYEALSAQYADHRDQLARRLERWATDVRRLAGDYSPFNERLNKMGWDLEKNGYRIRFTPRRAAAVVSPVPQVSAETYATIEALVMALKIDARPVERRALVRLILPAPTENLYFAVDTDTLRDLPDSALDQIAQRITEEFRSMLARS